MTRKFMYSPAILMQLCASSGACCLFGVSRPSAHIADIVYVHSFCQFLLTFQRACFSFYSCWPRIASNEIGNPGM